GGTAHRALSGPSVTLSLVTAAPYQSKNGQGKTKSPRTGEKHASEIVKASPLGRARGRRGGDRRDGGGAADPGRAGVAEPAGQDPGAAPGQHQQRPEGPADDR